MAGAVAAIGGVLRGQAMMDSAASRVASSVAAQAPDLTDETAFRAFYESCAPALRTYLARVTGNRTLADDLLQEAFIRLLRSGFVGSSEAHTRNYLFRIGTNLLRDHFRRPRRETLGLPESAAAPEKLGELDLRKDFQGAFSTLSPRERAMLWLAYVEGSTHREIAAILDVKPASLKVMLFRARSRLAERLRANGLAPEGGREDRR